MFNVINKILSNQNIKGINIVHPSNLCPVCGRADMYSTPEGRNYLYWKGEYFHNECWNNSRKRRGKTK